MGAVPEFKAAEFDLVLQRELGVPGNRRPYFLKWVAEFLEFCRLRHSGIGDGLTLGVFLDGLRKSGRLGFQVEQARIAVEAYWRHFGTVAVPEAGQMAIAELESGSVERREAAREASWEAGDWRMALAALEREVKLRHYSGRTLKAYRHWIRSFA